MEGKKELRKGFFLIFWEKSDFILSQHYKKENIIYYNLKLFNLAS